MAKKVTKTKDKDVEVVELKKPIVVRCVSPFMDVKAGLTRSVNDQWEVTDERLEELRAAEKLQNVTLVEVI